MNYYFNNECCKTTFVTKSESAEIVSSLLLITLPNTPIDIKNRDMIKFTICQDIPSEVTSDTLVKISVNGEKIYLLDRCGNFVRGDQVRKCVTYYTMISTSPVVGIVTSRNLCRTAYEYPVIPVVTCEVVKSSVVVEPFEEVVEVSSTTTTKSKAVK